MKVEIEYEYTEKFLPTKRHRNLRSRIASRKTTIEIKELDKKDFPIAFVVSDYINVYKNARNYDDFNKEEGTYCVFDESLRTYQNELFKPVRVTHGAAISLQFEKLSYIAKCAPRVEHGYCRAEESLFSEKSIIKESNQQEREREIKEYSQRYVICGGVIWEQC